ncbi:MAG: tripartite tricarboxylate transporter TctB family protein [Propylenella sp.]
MRSIAAKGEFALALLFGAVGILWVVIAAGKPLWQGFAPDSGFLPLIYGLLLTVLSVAVIVELVLSRGGHEERQPIGKPFLLLLVLAATVVGITIAGFAASIFLMLIFLFVGLERLPWRSSLAVAFGTTGILILIFKVWLNVPLPLGPLGI